MGLRFTCEFFEFRFVDVDLCKDGDHRSPMSGCLGWGKLFVMKLKVGLRSAYFSKFSCADD